MKPSRSAVRLALLVLAAVFVGTGASRSSADKRQPFADETKAAIAKMLSAMSIKPSGNVDRDFVAIMTAFRQGVIELARAEVRYGRSWRLRRLAHDIDIRYQEEIAAMRLAVGEAPPSPDVPRDQLPVDACRAR